MIAWSLSSLVLGVLAGVYLNTAGPETLKPLRSIVAGLGNVWLNAIGVVTLPLAVSNLMAALLKERDDRIAGRIGAVSLALVCALLLLGFGLSLTVVPPILRGLPVDRDMVAALSRTAADEARNVAHIPAAAAPGVSDFLTNLVPRNLVRSTLQEELFPLLVFGVMFALALRRARPENARVVIRFITGTAEALMVMVRWIIVCTPVGVFAIAMNYASAAGVKVVGILWQFLFVESGLMLAFLALFYVITTVGGGVPLARFARAALPAQVIAASTRSSLASLPALLEAAETGLGLNPAVSRMALPLVVSIYRANRPITAIVRLLFVAHFWSVPLSVGQIAVFSATTFLISFSSLGIPSTTPLQSIPAYLAAGLPLEGVILMEVLEPIGDIIKTVLNVTADLSLAAWVDRILARRSVHVVEPAVVTELVG